ncbi:MAG: hypothetical protein Q8L53_03105 [Aestuariivirga sp.]|nr:hypothetical protein [Aestuariivirga sp.]
MAILLIAAFLMTAAATLAALGTRFDFDRPIAIPIDRATQAAQLRYQAEFPTVASLMVVRVSAENSTLSQNAAQFIAWKLQADKANIGQVFIPGLGAFYDRFGFLYLPPDDINARVERVKRLKPLFQAIAAAPNLAGLSTLVNEVADAVQKGRSPQGLESLFVQISGTIKKQASNKPAPLDWARVAGLRIESKNKEWVAVVQPKAGRLQEARIAIEALTASVLKSRPTLKITSDFPPEAKANTAGSSGRQIVVCLLLSLLLFLPPVIASLRNVYSIVLFLVPPVAAIAAAFALASFAAPVLDQTVATLPFAVLLPVMGLSIAMASALRKPGKAGSGTSLIMLAAHEMGPLLLTLTGMVCTTWGLWSIMGFSSIARLSVIVMLAAFTGLAAALMLVPALASLISKPEGEPPADFYDQATAQNLRAIWHKLRPPLTALLMATSLFCVVFFSSLNFNASRSPGVEASSASRGLQFTVEGEAAAAKLVADLQQVPEVGTVRWMGTFLPQQVEPKRKILQDLAGTIPGVSVGGAVGPHDLLENLRGIEVGLRVISDGAGTDDGLRASAHELRRSLAVLASTSEKPESTAAELERLLFSDFGELTKAADGLSRLTAPKLPDLDQNLRTLYVAAGDRWRVEALPKRLISAAAFIGATKRVDAKPLGPLMTEQAELRSLASASKSALAFGFIFTLLITLAYLRNIVDWLIVVASSFLLLPLYAAFIVTTATAISPATLPALVMTSLFGVTTALLLVTRRRQPQIAGLGILLPVAVIVAIVLPIRLLHLQEFEVFSGALIMLLAVATAFNLTVVPQICAWTDRWRSSGPGSDKSGRAAQPREDFGDDIF